MRLWQKIAISSVAVTWLVLGIVVAVTVSVQTADLQKLEEESLRSALQLCRGYLESSILQQRQEYQERTLYSVAHFFFTNYVQTAGDKSTAYALSADGEYLFRRTTYDPAQEAPEEFYDFDSDRSAVWRIKTESGEVLVTGCELRYVGQGFVIYVSRDLSPLRARVVRTWEIGILLLCAGALFDAVLIFLIIRKAVRPITRLTEVSAAIAGGDYHLRTEIHTKDEIGTLSRAFDAMTDAVEEKILSQEEELKKRGLLIGALSHELKTPVTAILGYADSLLHMPLDEEQKIECARKIEEAGKRTASLSERMTELMGLSPETRLEKRSIPAEKLIVSLKDVFPSGVNFTTEVQTLFGEESLLYSLCCNLIQNALRACEQKEPIEVRFEKGEGKVLLVVEDRGCGIATEHLSLVTEPFYRVDKARSRAHGGAGLGLAICKRIAEWHGGTLLLESEVGRGTKATVSLPEFTN